jgi:hypothetical protein
MSVLRYALAAVAAACLAGGAVAQTTPAGPPASDSAPGAATSVNAAPPAPASSDASATANGGSVLHIVIASPPVPDTPENRARYGQPLSHAGQRTQAAGN